MKKIGLLTLLLTLATLLSAFPAQAGGAAWITLQSDTTAITAADQTINVSVNGAVQTPINGIGIILRYDPACVKVTGRKAGSIFTNQPVQEFLGSDANGKLDVTYYLVGQTASASGEGTFMQVTFKSLAACDPKISLDKDTLVLGVRQANGLTAALPGVEVRGEAVTFSAPADDQPAAQAAPALEVPSTGAATPAALRPNATILILAGTGIPLLAALGVFFFAFLKKPMKTSQSAAPFPGSQTAHGARLQVKSGAQAGRTVPITARRTLIGRHADCNIRVNGRGISYQHAEISERDGVYYLSDLNSHTGTYLNGKQLAKGYYPLRNGAEIRLGEEITCRFVEATGQA
jgi:hypothetical protein